MNKFDQLLRMNMLRYKPELLNHCSTICKVSSSKITLVDFLNHNRSSIELTNISMSSEQQAQEVRCVKLSLSQYLNLFSSDYYLMSFPSILAILTMFIGTFTDTQLCIIIYLRCVY